MNTGIMIGEGVSAIRLTAEKYWPGRYYYYFDAADKEFEERTDGGKVSSKTVTVPAGRAFNAGEITSVTINMGL